MTKTTWGSWDCTQCGETHEDPAFITTHCRACGAVHLISEEEITNDAGVEYLDVFPVYQGYSVPIALLA